MDSVPQEKLSDSDLVVDAIYQGGHGTSFSDEPLHQLLGVSNQGGFRHVGKAERPRFVVLTSSLADLDWPDELDVETGIFTYYGDNKKPGRELHDTPRDGNKMLRASFEAVHTGKRAHVPPFLVFTGAGKRHRRDMVFRGLAVPGARALSANEDLVAVWKIAQGRRFQNYRATFTILDVPRIDRAWLEDIKAGRNILKNAPDAWRRWVKSGRYEPLRAAQSIEIRSRSQQLPPAGADSDMLEQIRQFFARDPIGFEACAIEVVRIMLGKEVSIDATRPTRDGGRDAIGKLPIGVGPSSILVDFAIEAKCYNDRGSVGVKAMSRLISRLKHRQFGIMVTTSWVNGQAYSEIKEDQHPIIVVSGGDIVRVLKRHGINNTESVRQWLAGTFGAADARQKAPARPAELHL